MPAMPPPPPPPRRRRGRTLALTGLGCLGSLIVVFGALAAVGFTLQNSAGGKNSAIFDAASGFDPDADLTRRALAETDPDSIFWTMLHNQATQPVVRINHKYYSSKRDFQQDPIGWPGKVTQSRIDYANQRITIGDTDYERAESGEPRLDDQSRCIDGEKYATDHENRWKRDPISDIACQKSMMRTAAGDGIAPGGLTDEQADDYIHYIQTSQETNPVAAGEPELITHRDKRYVKLPVTITPVRNEYGYSGMMVFLWGMHDIDVHPATHLYSSFGAGGSGAQVTYYIDPATTLPAYTTIHETPGRHPDGRPRNDSSLGFRRVQYDYPRQWQPYRLDDSTSLDPFTLDWDPTIP